MAFVYPSRADEEVLASAAADGAGVGAEGVAQLRHHCGAVLDVVAATCAFAVASFPSSATMPVTAFFQDPRGFFRGREAELVDLRRRLQRSAEWLAAFDAAHHHVFTRAAEHPRRAAAATRASYGRFTQAAVAVGGWLDSAIDVVTGKGPSPSPECQVSYVAPTPETTAPPAPSDPPAAPPPAAPGDAPAEPPQGRVVVAAPSAAPGAESVGPAAPPAGRRVTRITRYEVHDVSTIFFSFQNQAQLFYLPEYTTYDPRVRQRLLLPCYFESLRTLIAEIGVEIRRLQGLLRTLTEKNKRLYPKLGSPIQPPAAHASAYPAALAHRTGSGHHASLHGPAGALHMRGAALPSEPLPQPTADLIPVEVNPLNIPPQVVFRPMLSEFQFLRDSLQLYLSTCTVEDDLTTVMYFRMLYDTYRQRATQMMEIIESLPLPSWMTPPSARTSPKPATTTAATTTTPTTDAVDTGDVAVDSPIAASATFTTTTFHSGEATRASPRASPQRPGATSPAVCAVPSNAVDSRLPLHATSATRGSDWEVVGPTTTAKGIVYDMPPSRPGKHREQRVWVLLPDQRGALEAAFETFSDLRASVAELRRHIQDDIAVKNVTHRTRVPETVAEAPATAREGAGSPSAAKEAGESESLWARTWRALQSVAGGVSCSAELARISQSDRDLDGCLLSATSPMYESKVELQKLVERLWRAVEAMATQLETQYPGTFYRSLGRRLSTTAGGVLRSMGGVSVVFAPA